MEKSIYFANSSGERIYGTFFSPTGMEKAKKGVLLCQPIAEEKIRVKRVFINFARFLCKKGYGVFLFDYFGEGESAGNFEDASLDTRTLDTVCALNYCYGYGQFNFFGIVGLRLGGSIALIASEEAKSLDFVVLWQPVINGYEYFQEWLKTSLAAQLVVYKEIKFNRKQLEEQLQCGNVIELEGYSITDLLFQNLRKLNLIEHKVCKSRKYLLVELTSQGSDLLYIKYLEALKSNNCLIDYLKEKKTFDWNNMRFYQPLPDSLFNSTFTWLESIYNGRNS